VLAAAIKADPAAPAPRHALGLSLAREKRMPEALAALAESVRLAPDDARYAYVYGVALHDTKRAPEAIRVLESALARHPYDRDILFALASYAREGGNAAKAAGYARRLVELEPDNAELRRFADEVSTAATATDPACAPGRCR
jgi:cytochrome c-type biogenesis protein CcmH/NrfG